MPRFAANLTMMFNEVPFLERFGAAARAGFQGVEFLFPYEFPAEVIRTELDRHNLSMVLFNMPAGDWAKGDRGLACDPGAVDRCRDGVRTAIEYAERLGCRQLHLMAGLRPAGASEEAMRATYVSNVQYAARATAAHDLTLLVEAINTRDMPGFYVNSSRHAFELIDAAAEPGVRFQYDVYHMQIMEGDLAKTLERHLARIGHIQIADPPARNEPGTGEINYTFLFDWIDRLGYTGWIGCEYRPQGKTEDGLEWMKPWTTPK
jgi:hydroxypyruvate isomerase